MTRIHIYQDRADQWRWTLFAANGKKLACAGEGYTKRSHARRMVERLFPWHFNVTVATRPAPRRKGSR